MLWWLFSVCHKSGWLPSNILKWCLEADKGRNTAFAVSHLCQSMQLQSVMSYVEKLKEIHMQSLQSDSVDDLTFSGDGNADVGVLADTNFKAQELRKCMKNIAYAIDDAFQPFSCWW